MCHSLRAQNPLIIENICQLLYIISRLILTISTRFQVVNNPHTIFILNNEIKEEKRKKEVSIYIRPTFILPCNSISRNFIDASFPRNPRYDRARIPRKIRPTSRRFPRESAREGELAAGQRYPGQLSRLKA